MPFQEQQALRPVDETNHIPVVSATHDFAKIALSREDRARTAPMPSEVSQPGDASEREARQVASSVMQAPTSSASGQSEAAREIPKPAPSTSYGSLPAHVQEVVSSVGQPLDNSTRAFMEDRFGADFSNVQIHTGEQAQRSAGEISSMAYTVGDHIAFAADQYAPATSSGRHLLAHELTHVLQNSQGTDQSRADVSVHASPAPIMRMGQDPVGHSREAKLLLNPDLDAQVERNWMRSEAEGSIYQVVRNRCAPPGGGGDVRLKRVAYQKKLSTGGELEADIYYYRYLSGGQVAAEADSPHFKVLAHIEEPKDAKQPLELVAQLVDWLDGHPFVSWEGRFSVFEEANRLRFQAVKVPEPPTPASEYWYDDEDVPT